MSAKYKPSDYEVLRRRCVEMKESGWKQKDIATALGLTPGWVSQTIKKYREQGAEALLARKPTGSPPKITPQQLAHLVEELNQGAVSHGFPGQIWTRARVNEAIGRLFGVSYDPTQVGRLLRKVGWSLQKPARKARQQNQQKVHQWREETVPDLKKAQNENRVIVYIDEAGFYLLPFVSRTWAPRGQTPVIEEKAGKEHLSLIAAMAPNRQLYVSGQNKAFDSEGVIGFLEYMCRRYRRKDLIVIWDGATIHRSQVAKDFLSRKKGRVYLVALPGYSPELNPVELLWSQLKRALKNQVFLSLANLAEILIEKIEEFRMDRKLIVSFFHKKGIAFFTG